MLFGSSKQNDRTVLVLHLTSGSVGAAIVHFRHGSLPEIISNARLAFFLEEEPAFENLEAKMLRTIRDVFSLVSKDGLTTLSRRKLSPHFEYVSVILSSPWILSRLKPVTVSKDKEFLLDKRMVDEVISKEEEQFKKDLKNAYQSECEVFESQVANIRLNGYEASLPISKYTKSAEVSIHMSAAERHLIKRVEEEVIRSFGIRRGFHIQGFMFTFWNVLTRSFKNTHTALLVDMSHETTDVFLIHKDFPAENFILPFGSTTVARLIKDKMNIPLTLAYSYLALFASNSLDDATREALNKILQSGEDEWKKMWEASVVKATKLGNLPQNVFLVSGRSHTELGKVLLESVVPGGVTLIGEDNKFTDELVKTASGGRRDDALNIIIAYLKSIF
ncbi:hypothetical protein KW790_00865 [Candidatus Parcubacteria bacterium]|nr:hypothetical protein [Candidatus Parcubacteria bacterium]